MTRYWALRTDQARRSFIWSELQAGRLRQGWGCRPDLDLEHLAEIRRDMGVDFVMGNSPTLATFGRTVTRR